MSLDKISGGGLYHDPGGKIEVQVPGLRGKFHGEPEAIQALNGAYEEENKEPDFWGRLIANFCRKIFGTGKSDLIHHLDDNVRDIQNNVPDGARGIYLYDCSAVENMKHRRILERFAKKVVSYDLRDERNKSFIGCVLLERVMEEAEAEVAHNPGKKFEDLLKEKFSVERLKDAGVVGMEASRLRMALTRVLYPVKVHQVVKKALSQESTAKPRSCLVEEHTWKRYLLMPFRLLRYAFQCLFKK